MINITPICKRFNKKPAHFKDNYADKSLFDYETVGKVKNIRIHESLLPEFIIWLSNGRKGCKELRTMLATEGIEKTLEFVRSKR